MVFSESEIRVRYAETDQMGVVYHGNYFAWLEVSRIELLDTIGVNYRALEEEGFFLPVLEAQARYRRPARFDDRIIIKAIIKSPPKARVTIDYEITRDGELLATAATTHGFIRKDGFPVRPPDRFLEAVNRHFPNGPTA